LEELYLGQNGLTKWEYNFFSGFVGNVFDGWGRKMEGWCVRYLAKEKKSCMCILNTLTRLWLQDTKGLIVDPLIFVKYGFIW